MKRQKNPNLSYRLVNYKADGGNVGDDYSSWMFHRLLGQTPCRTSRNIVFGVGSILTRDYFRRLEVGDMDRVHVFGSGARSISLTPSLNSQQWRIHCVRGPLTASAGKLCSTFSVADPGVLISRLLPRPQRKTSLIGVIPYFRSNYRLWKRVADGLNLRLILPNSSVEEFSTSLGSVDRVFCESMHGAIFADAYRIPWRPISGLNRVREGSTHAFKWTDWCSAMGVAFDPLNICVSLGHTNASLGRVKSEIKIPIVKNTIHRSIDKKNFQLSADDVLRDLQDELLERFEVLREELGHG